MPVWVLSCGWSLCIPARSVTSGLGCGDEFLESTCHTQFSFWRSSWSEAFGKQAIGKPTSFYGHCAQGSGNQPQSQLAWILPQMLAMPCPLVLLHAPTLLSSFTLSTLGSQPLQKTPSAMKSTLFSFASGYQARAAKELTCQGEVFQRMTTASVRAE